MGGGKKWPIEIHFVEEKGEPGYFFAFLPDFGHSACSATGDTIEEALQSLELVRQEVVGYYIDSHKALPYPSPPPWKK
jgi:predicted RNase H-like HicB family nuclease